jgi:uncharacterized protein (DUF2267 family)
MDYRMDYEHFVTLVEQDLGVGRECAERAIRATLQTLAERIAAGEARDLAQELSDELAPWVATTTDAEGFHVDEFVGRVAERERVDRAHRGTPRPCGVRGIGTGGHPAAAR